MRDAEDGAQGGPAGQDLRRVRAGVRLAQEMGARLGGGEILFGAVSGGGERNSLAKNRCSLFIELLLKLRKRRRLTGSQALYCVL